ncbi:MAG: cytoplasmic filament protein CfpA, partial [Deltaproteobacteria bacterium]|nr:cytoplasmic filament protein CfpA [Deltaproteobacteria bacterium]
SRGSTEFENATTAILMQRADVGGLVRGENAYSVVKASFRDNYFKPDKVMDITLAVNIRDAELVSAIVPYYMTTEHLIKEVIAKHIHHLVEKEVADVNHQLEVEGRPALGTNEGFFEKIKALENYVDDSEGEGSKRYQFISKRFLDRIKGLGAEVEKVDFDQQETAQMVSSFLEKENLHNRGWSTAVNVLTSILDSSRMGYQHVDNSKHTRTLEIREYQQTDIMQLPDERYSITLNHYTPQMILEEQVAYTAQVSEFRREVMRLWSVVDKIYAEEKSRQKFKDWDDMVNATIGRSGSGSWFGTPGMSPDKEEKLWNEITFIQRKQTSMEEMNQTYERVTNEYKERFRIVRRRLDEMFGNSFPDHRLVVEQRLNFLESQFFNFMSTVNPYHVQPGLLLTMNVTSIKRGRITVKGMADVLNTYLSQISAGFVGNEKGFTQRHANVSDAAGTFDEKG